MEIDDQWWRQGKSNDDDLSSPDADNAESEFPKCTACGGEYYDDEVLACPHCGHYLTKTAPAVQRFPRWIAWTGLVLLLCFLFAQGWFLLFIQFLFP